MDHPHPSRGPRSRGEGHLRCHRVERGVLVGSLPLSVQRRSLRGRRGQGVHQPRRGRQTPAHDRRHDRCHRAQTLGGGAAAAVDGGGAELGYRTDHGPRGQDRVREPTVHPGDGLLGRGIPGQGGGVPGRGGEVLPRARGDLGNDQGGAGVARGVPQQEEGRQPVLGAGEHLSHARRLGGDHALHCRQGGHHVPQGAGGAAPAGPEDGIRGSAGGRGGARFQQHAAGHQQLHGDGHDEDRLRPAAVPVPPADPRGCPQIG